MSGYRDLKVYERSYAGARSIYKLTQSYPKEEVYGISSQMRRSSLSIALNIAEGYAKRESQAEFKRFLYMALGSANELSVLIEFSKDLGYIGEEVYLKASKEYEEISKMLNALIQTITRQNNHI